MFDKQHDSGHLPAVAEDEEELDPEWRRQGPICKLSQLQVSMVS